MQIACVNIILQWTLNKLKLYSTVKTDTDSHILTQWFFVLKTFVGNTTEMNLLPYLDALLLPTQILKNN